MKWVFACVALLLAAQPASAVTLWLHNDTEESWFDPIEDHPDATGKYEYVDNQRGFANADTTVSGTVDGWVVPTDLHLDATRDVEIIAWIGSDAGWGVVAGQIDVSFQILANGELLADAPAQEMQFVPNPAPTWKQGTWSASLEMDFLPAGTQLSWFMKAEGVANDFAVSASESRGGISHFKLPALEVAEEVEVPLVFEDVAGLPLFLEFASVAPATTVTQYNWSAPGGLVDWALDGAITDGAATIVVRDAEGTVQMNESFEAGTTGQWDLVPGSWTITVSLEEFVGEGNLSIEPAAVAGEGEAPEAPSADPSSPSDSVGQDESLQEDDPEEAVDGGDKESPPAPVMAVLVGLIGVAFMRRRFA